MVPVVSYADDSDGIIGGSIIRALDILDKLAVNELPEDVRNDLFGKALKESQHKRYDGWDEWALRLIDIAVHIHRGNREFGLIEKALDHMVQRNAERDYFSSYTLETAMVLKYGLYSRAGLTDDAETILNSNINMPAFRRLALNRYYDTGDLESCEALARAGVEFDEKSRLPGLVYEWKLWLLKIAQKKGDTELVRTRSKELFIGECKIEFYRIYKKTFSEEEWAGELNSLIENMATPRGQSYPMIQSIGQIYVDEGLIERLLEHVKKYPDIINEYYRYLLRDYPEDVYDIFAHKILDLASRKTDRSGYREIKRRLVHLKKIGGNKKVTELVEVLKEQYPRRPALHDELKSV